MTTSSSAPRPRAPSWRLTAESRGGPRRLASGEPPGGERRLQRCRSLHRLVGVVSGRSAGADPTAPTSASDRRPPSRRTAMNPPTIGARPTLGTTLDRSRRTSSTRIRLVAIPLLRRSPAKVAALYGQDPQRSPTRAPARHPPARGPSRRRVRFRVRNATSPWKYPKSACVAIPSKTASETLPCTSRMPQRPDAADVLRDEGRR
jgi:hypothetical protein